METTTVAKDSENPSDRSQIKFMTLLSKNVYRTEIDGVEPKLWRFTCVSLILGHPVCYLKVLSEFVPKLSVAGNY